MLRVKVAVAVIFSLLLTIASVARGDTLDFVRASKTLVVGVKADYEPFGFRDKTGAIIGFEPELAAYLAERFGAELQLVAVTAGNRMDLLRKGKIDVIIATMTDRPDRREAVQIIEPFYYADFINVILRKNSGVLRWEDLRGKTICATTGSIQVPVAQKYGAQLEMFPSTSQSLSAMENGKCLGYIYDQSFIIVKLLEKKWSTGFEMPLIGIMEMPWTIAVRKGEERFKLAIQEAVAGLIKSGQLIELQQKWRVPPSQFVLRMYDKYRESQLLPR